MELILKYYLFKRLFCFLDEWLTYLLLIYLYSTGAVFQLFTVGGFAIMTVVTAYKNLELIEKKLDICPNQYFLYPFFRGVN